MRWIKVAAVVIGALIAFAVLGAVWHLLVIAGIVLAIGVAIALAVKAHSEYRLARERRAQVKAQRRAERERRQLGAEPVAAAPTSMPQRDATVPRHHDVNVEDELARLKREVGAG